jgi:hypothetical protein
MNQPTTDRLTRPLIVLQLLATVAVVGSTVAAVVVDVPLYLPLILLGAAGLALVVMYTRRHQTGVLLFGLSGLLCSLFYLVSIYALNLPLSPLYLFVLAYAIVALVGGIWLLVRLK